MQTSNLSRNNCKLYNSQKVSKPKNKKAIIFYASKDKPFERYSDYGDYNKEFAINLLGAAGSLQVARYCKNHIKNPKVSNTLFCASMLPISYFLNKLVDLPSSKRGMDGLVRGASRAHFNYLKIENNKVEEKNPAKFALAVATLSAYPFCRKFLVILKLSGRVLFLLYILIFSSGIPFHLASSFVISGKLGL